MTPKHDRPTRHRFILNPYCQERFASCPKCRGLTEERKFPLMIHVHPLNPVTINKTCRFCASCDLIIAHKDELEEQLVALFEIHNPEIVGNEYLVMGTLDHDVWDRGRRFPLSISEMVSELYVFQEVLLIESTGEQGTPSNPDRRASWSPSVARGKSAKRKPRRNGT
jgi:hypothetical protein